ncbi:type VI secretion system baseplate subunit TssF [Morganella morganii]|uniref:type VI secretion system baseplate subunit TssF n=1 Tax=Morganella morganii TaxID=582 RepID=UPI001C453EF5|nr:type VI secretion system baseplate subunit TssF [Morganella morganii]QXO66247.1 type VI secretion system baseplate subunit TssF [Morganella morganii]
MLSDRFLTLYNEELRFLREEGLLFAKANPQVAQHLGMMPDGVLDPFVERLLEGTAFLSARVHERLNNEQPEVAIQMINRLAPYWFTPLPSIATVAVEPDLTSPQWHSDVTLPRGSKLTLHDTAPGHRNATFTTGRDLNIQPLVIAHAECATTPSAQLPQSVLQCMQDGRAHISLTMNTQGVVSLSELNFSPMTLTFAGDIVHANQLLTAIQSDTLRVILWCRQDNKAPQMHLLEPGNIRQAGLQAEDALLPAVSGELPGSRLLREYFAAPSRFFSIELHGLMPFLQAGDKCTEFNMIFVLNKTPVKLTGNVSRDDFRLFSTPVINLSRRRCSPVLVNGEHTEYPVIVDKLNPGLYEIHHLLQVDGLLADKGYVPFSPLHGYARFDEPPVSAGYSLRRVRRVTEDKYDSAPAMPKDSLFISLSAGPDNFSPDSVRSLSIEALVCDRHLDPSRLQQPVFRPDTALPVGPVEILRTPSRPQGVPCSTQAWKVLQLLSVNPLRYALPDFPDNSQLLREWLSLFCPPDDSRQQRRIDSLRHAVIAHRFECNPLPGPLAWSRGAEITIDLRGNHHSDRGAWLFARILHHALAEYCELGQTLRMQLNVDSEPLAQWEPIDGR